MASIIKLRKGLDISLKGKAKKEKRILDVKGEYALLTASFTGVHPKVVVHEGDEVRVGDSLFISKNDESVVFASPVSGKVTEVLRGDRRKLLHVKVMADGKQTLKEFQIPQAETLTSESVIKLLLESGLFGYLRQLPYGIVPKSTEKPRAIFISAFRDMPLAADFEFELEGRENDFQCGLTTLSKIAKTYLGVNKKQTATALTQAKDVEVNVFDGPAPAGNASVQINNIAPVNKGEVVWMVDPAVVLFIGKFFRTGVLEFKRTIAVAGSEIKAPHYAETLIGTALEAILEGQLSTTEHLRLINGNPLTGVKTTMNSYLATNVSEVTAIPEGDDKNEMFGWILPRFNHFSMNRSYFSWLLGKKEYKLDARIKGGERRMIMSGEYDKVLPMDIYGEFLIKAIIAEDIDKMEQLGIYEVCPEDFALAEFVDSSKLELQKIVRRGLDMLCKENG